MDPVGLTYHIILLWNITILQYDSPSLIDSLNWLIESDDPMLCRCIKFTDERTNNKWEKCEFLCNRTAELNKKRIRGRTYTYICDTLDAFQEESLSPIGKRFSDRDVNDVVYDIWGDCVSVPRHCEPWQLRVKMRRRARCMRRRIESASCQTSWTLA